MKTYEIDGLNEHIVNVIITTSTEVDGEILKKTVRRSYNNSRKDRLALRHDVEDPYLSAILLVWGENPTIIDTPVYERPIETE